MQQPSKQAVGGQMQITGVKQRQVFVTPVVASSIFAKDWQTPLAMIMLNETGRTPSALETINKLFHFTKTEGRVAAALLDGQSLEDYASEAKVTLNTVRRIECLQTYSDSSRCNADHSSHCGQSTSRG